ncbi:copper radical oxidase [Laetiporus sulphureus 93-53]|uniref:Copper radical oxidase n=1 Tax=Laetiporus sulphureus 93-53 TaxID=1314785 RepID=A0A165GTD0_9APHY|nr:copper radical oxidase [Laetiporus sulphureus 93-53]KZT10785.1 copper radical oxidase [Laetiporus sulphureus 93-53]
MFINKAAVVAAVLYACRAYGQTAATPGQPSTTDAPLGQFVIVGNSIASAQQMFVGTLDKVYIVDKTERNPTQIDGHPAWGAEYTLSTNEARPMNVITNSFCAGGNVLGNGTWVNVGGNQAVTYGGLAAASQTGGPPYDDPDGGQSIRLLNPCDNEQCDWTLTTPMTTRRWYPSVETLENGTLIIIGGCDWGGYVNDASQTNPTYEFFPPIPGVGLTTSPLLVNTLPANLYPLTWLLPSGLLFVQANWGTALIDYKARTETELPSMVDAVRTYPASAGTAMLPLTPANNWTATILFCGGSNISSSQWVTTWDIAEYPASNSCVTVTPDISATYIEDDPLPEVRSMGNLILLPNGKILCLNGAGTGTAGYGNVSWAIGQSFADNPVLTPVIYDPAAPAGQRWSREGLSASTVPRMYHSSATLLPDGSVMVSGSNPNADYTVGADVKYPTEYRVEYFYPSYYNTRRPEPQGLPTTLSYGGPYFNVSLTSDDLFGNVQNVKNTTVIVIRTGFSTHTMNMGQRYVQLNSTYTTAADGSAVLHVSQLPPNPAVLAPGPALLFVVVNGVPSVAVQVMVGSGQLGTQPISAVVDLPSSSVAVNTTTSSTAPGSVQTGQGSHDQTSSGISSVFAHRGLMGWLLLFTIAQRLLL